MEPPLSLSVFFPAYNDARTIGKLVADALAVMPALADDYEIIVVNDGSTDETAAVLDELARDDAHVRVVAGQFVKHCCRLVSAAIIDDDDFVIVGERRHDGECVGD